MKRLAIAALAVPAIGWAQTAQAAPLAPVRMSTIPLGQLLGTAETIGEWKLLNGNGDLKLVRVLSREGGECEASEEDDSNLCPRFILFVVVDGELADPTQYTAFQLPETLGWDLPEAFKPDENSETSTVPLRACEMKKTARGYGWRGVSYTLTVTEKIVGASTPFAFSASLDRQPSERLDCANSR